MGVELKGELAEGFRRYEATSNDSKNQKYSEQHILRLYNSYDQNWNSIALCCSQERVPAFDLMDCLASRMMLIQTTPIHNELRCAVKTELFSRRKAYRATTERLSHRQASWVQPDLTTICQRPSCWIGSVRVLFKFRWSLPEQVPTLLRKALKGDAFDEAGLSGEKQDSYLGG